MWREFVLSWWRENWGWCGAVIGGARAPPLPRWLHNPRRDQCLIKTITAGNRGRPPSPARTDLTSRPVHPLELPEKRDELQIQGKNYFLGCTLPSGAPPLLSWYWPSPSSVIKSRQITYRLQHKYCFVQQADILGGRVEGGGEITNQLQC